MRAVPIPGSLADLLRERFAEVERANARLQGTLEAAAAMADVSPDLVRGVDDRADALLVEGAPPLEPDGAGMAIPVLSDLAAQQAAEAAAVNPYRSLARSASMADMNDADPPIEDTSATPPQADDATGGAPADEPSAQDGAEGVNVPAEGATSAEASDNPPDANSASGEAGEDDAAG